MSLRNVEKSGMTFDYGHENPYSVHARSIKEHIAKKVLKPDFSSVHFQSPYRFPDDFCKADDSSALFADIFQHGENSSETKPGTCKYPLQKPSVSPSELQVIEKSFEEHLSISAKFPPLPLPVKDLQVLKVGPWSEIIYEDSIPSNIIYQQAKQKANTLFPVEDLLTTESSRSPLKPMALEASSVQIPAISTLIQMSPKDLVFPETPRCNYLQQIVDREMEELKTIEAARLKQKPLEVISVNLPDWALEVLQVMECRLFADWKNLMDADVKSLMPLKMCKKLAELRPSTTRICLVKLNEEILNAKKDVNKSHDEMKLLEMLPLTLSVHGIAKVADVFVHVDFTVAHQVLEDFARTHQDILHDEFKLLASNMANRFAGGSDNLVHPKLTVLRDQIVEHLKTDPGGKVWVRLQRYTNQTARSAHQLISKVGVKCYIDPRIFPCEDSRQSWSVLIAERLIEDVPAKLISLIVDYEHWTKPMDDHLSVIPRRELVSQRPEYDEDARSLSNPLPSGPLPTAVSSPKASQEVSVGEARSPKMPEEAPENDARNQEDHKEVVEAIGGPSSSQNSLERATPEEEYPHGDFSKESTEEPDYLVEEKISSVDNERPNSRSSGVTSLDAGHLPADVVEEDIGKGELEEEDQVVEQVTCEGNPTLDVEEMVAEEDDGEPALLMASHLSSNKELVSAIMAAGSPRIYECDYSFLGNCGRYQPDFLLSSSTALLIVDQDTDSISDIRLRILTTSFKCSVCWVIVLSSGLTESRKPPPLWTALAGLARFYESKSRTSRYEFGFQMRLRLAMNYHQIGYIIYDVARDLSSPDITAQPINEGVKLLLQFRHFNAVSAHLLLQHISPAELISLPLKKFPDRVPSKSLRRRVKLFRHFVNASEEDHPMEEEEDSVFGQLKCSSNETDGSKSPIVLSSPSKRLRLDGQHRDSSSSLMDVWTSPVIPPNE